MVGNSGILIASVRPEIRTLSKNCWGKNDAVKQGLVTCKVQIVVDKETVVRAVFTYEVSRLIDNVFASARFVVLTYILFKAFILAKVGHVGQL